MGDSASSLRPTFSVSHDPPVPIAATFGLTSLVLDVTFDQPLTPQPTAAANWPLDANFFDYQGMMAGNAVGSHVIISRIKVNPTGNPDTVSYLGAPPDVVSARGIPAAPFANFPLTVTP